MKSRDQLKFLLLQIRDDEQTKVEEFYEFLTFAELKPEQVTLLNTFDTPDFSADCIKGYDGLFVGGSSDVSVLKPQQFPFINNCRALLRYCYDKSIPVFASCFGFQLVALEFGGEVVVDSENMEMGIYPIDLTKEAKNDPLLCDLPSPFFGVSGHKERAATIPDNAINFGYTRLCPHHIFKLQDKPFYAFQFHPEVDRKDLIARLTRYRERYLADANSLQAIIDRSVQNTDASNQLVKHFVDRIVLGVAASCHATDPQSAQ